MKPILQLQNMGCESTYPVLRNIKLFNKTTGRQGSIMACASFWWLDAALALGLEALQLTPSNLVGVSRNPLSRGA
jgi:hypothetical protein